MTTDATSDSLRETVRAKYAERARRVSEESGSCCGTTSRSPITSNLYGSDEVGGHPRGRGEGVARLRQPDRAGLAGQGETVLDLGSGGGIDVLLSARRVGPTGFAYGLDMTDEMLALAEKNRARAGRRERQVPQGPHRGDPAARTTPSTWSSPTASSTCRPTRAR